MKAFAAAVVLFLTLTTVPERLSAGTDQYFSEPFCVPQPFDDWNSVPRLCPFFWQGQSNVTVNRAALAYNDTSDDKAISAFIMLLNWDGIYYYGATKYSCSQQWDGCGQNQDPKFKGNGSLVFYDPIDIDFTAYPLTLGLAVIEPSGHERAVLGYTFNLN